MEWFYDHGYDYGRLLPIHQVHGFILNKPSEIRRHLIQSHGVLAHSMRAPRAQDALSDEDILRVHAPSVLAGLKRAKWVAQVVELVPLGWLPSSWVSAQVVTPQKIASAGTFAAMRVAFGGGWACNLSGGFHHARPDLCHGFCLLNDVAAAVARLRGEGLRKRVLVLDLDLHQGDGNTAAFASDADTFTASLHQDSAFPHPKLVSDLDVSLPDGTDDAAYLAALDAALAQISTRFAPEVIVYIAGVDPFVDDPMSALRVSKPGLAERDARVARFAKASGCGLIALPAGGYCAHSPALHAQGFAQIAHIETT
jgi:acetoin utilization deacetylase AcuC-like enzyme